MRTGARSGIEQVQAGLAALNAADVPGLPDEQVRAEVLDLLTCLNQLTGALLDRVGAFDRRDLSQADAQRATSTWLVDYGRMSKGAALRWLVCARHLAALPALADGVRAGAVSMEQLAKVADLVRHIGIDRVRDFDEILAQLCASVGPLEVGKACARIWAMVDPDGAEPDPEEDFARRELTFSQLGAMLYIRGRLDPEGAAALQTAVDALMRPPTPGDERTAAQRRADAVVDLARGALATGDLPEVGGERPQVGILVTPQILFGSPTSTPPGCPHAARPEGASPAAVATDAAGEPDPAGATNVAGRPNPAGATDSANAVTLAGITNPAGATDSANAVTLAGITNPAGATDSANAVTLAGRPNPTGASRPGSTTEADDCAAEEPGDRPQGMIAAKKQSSGSAGPPAAPAMAQSGDVSSRCDCDALTAAGVPHLPERPWLNWVGEVSPQLAQRLACDGVVWRLVLDPRTGLPLDVGRKLRIVPWWMRKAIRARDRTCRWPGCDMPSEWTDAHHLTFWWRGGTTTVDQIISLCRYHHGLVHEGQWTLRMDHATGEVWVNRPGGRPYELGPSRPWTSPSRHGPQPTPTRVSPPAPWHPEQSHPDQRHPAPGHPVPGRSAPGHSIRRPSGPGHAGPGHAGPGHAVPGRSASGHPAPGYAVPGPSVPGPSLPRPPRRETDPPWPGAA